MLARVIVKVLIHLPKKFQLFITMAKSNQASVVLRIILLALPKVSVGTCFFFRLKVLFNMTSPTVYKALDLYADIFQRFETLSVTWNKKTKTFIYNFNPRGLFIYGIGHIVFVGGNLVSCLFILIRNLFTTENRIPLFALVMIAGIACLTIFGLASAFALIVCGRSLIVAMNQLFKIEISLKEGKFIIPFV